jgi:hypothetical protein
MPPMRTGGRTAAGLLAILVLAIGACTSQAAEPPERADHATTSSTATSSTEPPPTTAPTRAFEPLLADPDLPLADQVEAAYLFHWEVLLHAVSTGRTEFLELAYADAALDYRVSEVEAIVAEGFRVDGNVEHDFEIRVLGVDRVVVADRYKNLMFRVNPGTRERLDEPTGLVSSFEYEMRRIGDQWLVVNVARIEQ